jgi:hypothetical protein
MSTPLEARYQQLARSRDPRTRRMAERQLARVKQVQAPCPPDATPSPWRHVPLAELFA